jgi:two-component system LytT family sensor kinase
MALKRYSKKEPLIFVWVIVPYTICMNALVFGACVFSSWPVFGFSFLCSCIYLLATYFVFGIVALFIQKRFPSAADMFKRIAIMLPVFYVMNVFVISGIYHLYNQLSPITCNTKPGMFTWTIVYGCLMSTMITFLNEGVANWEAWKASLSETERLKNAYQRSKVLGLRGQINPHFLFNCFNTLSELIQEDETKAERFLDEMSKVHRYLLSSGDELLIPLHTEMKFAESFLYLARERFGGAIEILIDIDSEALQRRLPSLSMHVILENIIYTNALSKNNPLRINIFSNGDNELSVTNSLHEKSVVQNYNIDDGLDNLLNTYKILNTTGILIDESDNKRTLLLPLFDKNESAL